MPLTRSNIHTEPDWDEQHRKAAERMAQVDAQEPDVRALIHEFDVNPVVDAYRAGFRTPDAIRRALRAARLLARVKENT